MNLPEKNEWQFLASDGDIMPWFTKPFLDQLQQTDLSKMNVFEWGTGWGTIWFAKKCRTVYSVDTEYEWSKAVWTELETRTANRGHGYGDYSLAVRKHPAYAMAGLFVDFNIVIIDGENRVECALECYKYLSPGSLVILDNSERVQEYREIFALFDDEQKWPRFDFRQPDHPEWTTTYWAVGL